MRYKQKRAEALTREVHGSWQSKNKQQREKLKTKQRNEFNTQAFNIFKLGVKTIGKADVLCALSLSLFYSLHMVNALSNWLYSLLLEAQYQPVIENILLWLPSAVSKQG